VVGEFEYTAEDLWEAETACEMMRGNRFVRAVLKIIAACLCAASLVALCVVAAWINDPGLSPRQHGKAAYVCGLLVTVALVCFGILIRRTSLGRFRLLRALDSSAPGNGFRVLVFAIGGVAIVAMLSFLFQSSKPSPAAHHGPLVIGAPLPPGARPPQELSTDESSPSPLKSVLVPVDKKVLVPIGFLLLFGSIRLLRIARSLGRRWDYLGSNSATRRLATDGTLRQRRRVTLSQAEITIDTIDWRRRIPWRSIVGYREMPHVFVLALSDATFEAIPARTFADPALANWFRQMLSWSSTNAAAMARGAQ
jgi:hypothetical protein